MLYFNMVAKELLPGSNKRSGVLEFPTNDVGPLVELQGQVTMRLDPLSVCRVHNRLGSGTHCNGFGEISTAALSNPSDFRRETFNVILLLVQRFLGDEHGEVSILHIVLLDDIVEEFLFTSYI